MLDMVKVYFKIHFYVILKEINVNEFIFEYQNFGIFLISMTFKVCYFPCIHNIIIDFIAGSI